MDMLIIYYSRTGVTHRAAEQLAATSGWPVAEVTDETSRSGFGGDARCILDVLLANRRQGATADARLAAKGRAERPGRAGIAGIRHQGRSGSAWR